MKKIITVLILAIVVSACQPEGRIYSEHKELSPELEWLKKDIRTFSVPIENNTPNYNLSLSFRYVNGYPYQTLNIKVTETSPSGEATENNYELKVVEDNGDYIGQPGLDIWDSEHLIAGNKKYEETGTYTYSIEHVMPKDPVPFAMEIGVVVDKAK